MQLTLEQHGFKPCVHLYVDSPPINPVNASSFPYDFLTIFFPLAYFINTCKICDFFFLMWLVRLPLNSGFLVVRFFGESEVIHRFPTARGFGGLTPVLFRGQLHLFIFCLLNEKLHQGTDFIHIAQR